MSPLKSKAQLGKFAELVKSGQMSKDEFHKWLNETPDIKKLPERAPKPQKIGRIKKI